jgi:uncharacterized protein (TIGR03083 family)
VAERLRQYLAAFAEQSAALTEWLDALPAEAFAQPSALEGWDVRTLVGHVLLVQRGLTERLDSRDDETPLSAAQFVQRYRPAADQILERTLSTTADHTPDELITALRATLPSDAPAEVKDRTVIRGARGAITALDWAATRLVELVVHTDDLSRSLPDREPIPLQRNAMAAAVRTLAEIFATQAPGRSVELRVPPFVAVQAIEGPRHTRGTPPNVIETNPLTWVRLGTGRVAFATAVAEGSVRASGNRADLSAYLPVLS